MGCEDCGCTECAGCPGCEQKCECPVCKCSPCKCGVEAPKVKKAKKPKKA